jgi:hypothetical protein
MGFDCENLTVTYTDGWEDAVKQTKSKGMIKYYIFCIRWIWKNREWKNNRHKWKAMDRDYRRHLIAKKVAK